MSFTPMSSLLCPLHEGGAPRQAGTEPGEQHVVATLDPALANRLLQRKRDGSARGVAVLVDVDRHPVERQPDPARGRVGDPEVRLGPRPSEPRHQLRKPAPLGAGRTIAAPAPSPKMTAVPRFE